MLEQIAFYIISAIILGGAIAMVSSRQLVRSVIWMVVSFIGVGCLFLLLQAEFIFAVQILVYAGGIVVLFLFVIMLVNLSDFEQVEYLHHQWLPALLLVMLILAEVGFLLWAGALGTPTPEAARVDVMLRGMGGKHRNHRSGALHRVLAALRGRVGAVAGGHDRRHLPGQEASLRWKASD